MSNILQVSDKELSYNINENIKIISLTNLTASTGVPKPIMFKVKTNKVDLVDAKPSCGYISSKANANTVKISIRVPKKEPFSAKVQILYVIYGQVTQQIVSANRQHLNLTQYNDFYQKIKKNNYQVKNHIIDIIKTNEGPSNNKSLNSQEQEQIQEYMKQSKPSSISRSYQYQRLSEIKDQTSAQQKQKKKEITFMINQKEKNEKNSVHFSVSNKDEKSKIQFSLSSNKNSKDMQMTKCKLITLLISSLIVGFLLGYFLHFSLENNLNSQLNPIIEQIIQKFVQTDSIETEVLQKQELKSGKNEGNGPRLIQTQNSERNQEFGQNIVDGNFQYENENQKIQHQEHHSQQQYL